MKIRVPAGVRVAGRAVGGRSFDVGTLVEQTDDTGRALLLNVALRELERADKEEDKASRRLYSTRGVTSREVYRERERALSEAGLRVDDWSNVVDRITERFAEDEYDEDEDEDERREAISERIERQHEAELEYQEADSSAEWEFSCEYLSGESSSNVDVNFRIRRTDGAKFDADEARRAMSMFRERVAAGHMSAPRGFRIAGIDWRNPAKSTDWTGSGSFPSSLGGLENVLYIAADHPSLWRLGGVDD